jgi:hypothetical protein
MSYCIDEHLFNQFEEGVMSRPNTCQTVARHEERGDSLLELAETNDWNLGAMIHFMACPTCRQKMQKANAITALRKSMLRYIDPDFEWCSQQSTK